jgi:hypothetical protein
VLINFINKESDGLRASKSPDNAQRRQDLLFSPDQALFVVSLYGPLDRYALIFYELGPMYPDTLHKLTFDSFVL